MNNHELFAMISGTSNYDLNRAILEAVNGLGYERLSFKHLAIDYFIDAEDDTKVKKNERICDKHLVIFESIRDISLLVRFSQIAWAAKFQYSAKSITAVLPFMIYRRQDHEEKKEEINRNAWLAHLFAASGVNRIILCDIHSNATIENMAKVGIEAYDVSAAPAFAEKLKVYVDLAKAKGQTFYIYSPDRGSVKRAIELAKELEAEGATHLKRRLRTGKTEIYQDDAEVARLSEEYRFPIIPADERLTGASVCIREDELETGNTVRDSGWRLREELGVDKLYLAFTHPAFAPGFRRNIMDEEVNPFDQIFASNTIHRGYAMSTGGIITNVDVSQVIGNQLYKVMVGLE